MKFYQFSILTILLFLFGNLQAEAKIKIKILQHHTRHAVFQNIVDYLSRSEDCWDGANKYACNEYLEVEDIVCKKSESECFEEFKDQVDIIYSPSVDWDLSSFTPINANVFFGALSVRVPVVLNKNLVAFRYAYVNKKLKEQPIVFNSKWNDFAVLESEGYKLLAVDSYDKLAGELRANRAFFTLRGVEEILSEPDFLNKKEFTIDRKKLVYYPYTVKVYVNNKRTKNGITLWHRLKYLEKFSPHFFKEVGESSSVLDSNDSCSLYVGSVPAVLEIKKCTLKNIGKALRENSRK